MRQLITRNRYRAAIVSCNRLTSCAKGKLMQRRGRRRRKLVDATVKTLRQGVDEGVVRADLSVEVMAKYLPGLLRARTRDLLDFPKKHRSHHVLVELFCNGTLECAIEKNDARGLKREFACAR